MQTWLVVRYSYCHPLITSVYLHTSLSSKTSVVRVGRMVEELWYHALIFLDRYRTGDGSCNIGDLYQFGDTTGVLSTHDQCLAQLYEDRQVDMKMMYYELIRMMIAHERDNCKDQELYDSTKSVAKIEGYQELTNKLQRFLNQRFIMDIDELNKKHDGVTHPILEYVNINKKIGDLEKRVEVLAADNKILSESSASCKSTNEVLSNEIATLKDKMVKLEDGNYSQLHINTHQMDSYGSESIPMQNDKISYQNKAIAKLDDKMEKVINQANTLLINDATHLERICYLERQGKEFIGKLSNLESADLYLQESHRMVTERTSLVEKYSKFVEEKVNLVTKQTNEEDLSKPSTEQDVFESRVNVLERSVLNLQNNGNRQEDIIDKNDHSEKKESENNVNYSELFEKYEHIIGKVENIEVMLDQQAKSLKDYSEMFPNEYLRRVTEHFNTDYQKESTLISKETLREHKSEKLETSTHLEIHSKEILDESVLRNVISLKTEVENLKNQLHLYSKDQTKGHIQFASVERQFIEVCRKYGNSNNIFEFLEMVVGMNKSLNEMMVDLVSSQTQLHMVKREQKQIWNDFGVQKQAIEYHEDNFEKMFKAVESVGIKEGCDYELIRLKIEDMESIIDLMRERIEELERIRNGNKSASTAKEENMSIDGSVHDQENKGLSSSKQGRNRWLGNWFARQHGAICC